MILSLFHNIFLINYKLNYWFNLNTEIRLRCKRFNNLEKELSFCRMAQTNEYFRKRYYREVKINWTLKKSSCFRSVARKAFFLFRLLFLLKDDNRPTTCKLICADHKVSKDEKKKTVRRKKQKEKKIISQNVGINTANTLRGIVAN